MQIIFYFWEHRPWWESLVDLSMLFITLISHLCLMQLQGDKNRSLIYISSKQRIFFVYKRLSGPNCRFFKTDSIDWFIPKSIRNFGWVKSGFVFVGTYKKFSLDQKFCWTRSIHIWLLMSPKLQPPYEKWSLEILQKTTITNKIIFNIYIYIYIYIILAKKKL